MNESTLHYWVKKENKIPQRKEVEPCHNTLSFPTAGLLFKVVLS